MKKILLVLFVSGSLFTSCKKCVDCTDCPEGITLDQTEICEDDFDSKADYKTAIELVEAFGCNCK
jgi:predicted aldo/keto reductase-like oxidoreductase